jgi:hypothetical protein
VLPFGRLWYAGLNLVSNAVGYAMHREQFGQFSHILVTQLSHRDCV